MLRPATDPVRPCLAASVVPPTRRSSWWATRCSRGKTSSASVSRPAPDSSFATTSAIPAAPAAPPFLLPPPPPNPGRSVGYDPDAPPYTPVIDHGDRWPERLGDIGAPT